MLTLFLITLISFHLFSFTFVYFNGYLAIILIQKKNEKQYYIWTWNP